MTTESPSIMSHVSVGTNNFERAVAFYDRVLATVGARRIMDHPGAVAYGKQFPEFWVQRPFNEQEARPGNGQHFAFLAASTDQVQEFYDAAMKAGATSDGEPGPRPDYGPHYHGCFVFDLDGNKIEAMHWSGPTG